MALSLYRKYRPNVFSDVVGQEHVERTLINAIGEDNVAHAYLFCGPRGTGKTTTARLLAKALLCENAQDGQPDGTCAQCQAIAEGAHPDVYELDAASRTGVDNVREEIISRVSFAPTQGRFKVYIIDEVHMLSTAAFNALLKTLEEPPEHVIFVLCTTDPHKVPETIQSRCQRFDFRRLTVEEITKYLQRICDGEGFSAEDGVLEYIANKASGGMRDATTSLEQAAVFTDGKLTLANVASLFGQLDESGLFELCSHIARRDTAACLAWLSDTVATGIDLTQLARELASHLRNLYVTALTGGSTETLSCSQPQLERYQEQAAAFGPAERLSRALTVCGDLLGELRWSQDARLSTEIAFVRLCREDSDLTLESLAARIAALEAGAPVTAAPAPAAVATQPEPEPQPAATAQPEPQPVAEAAPEPQPEPEPQPSAQAASGLDSDASPARVLAALLTAVKREDVATAALLNGITLQPAGNGWVLLFPAGAEFAMRIASTGDAAKLIASSFEQVMGQRVSYECRLGTSAAPEPFDDGAGSGYDDAPVYEQPIYANTDYGEDFDFDDASATAARPVDQETAANFADALSVFGDGVQVQEIDGE